MVCPLRSKRKHDTDATRSVGRMTASRKLQLTAPTDVFVGDLLAGQVAFVTGGGTGIGKEIARVLGRHGARIAIASRRRDVLEEAAAELGAEGIDVWTRHVRRAQGRRGRAGHAGHHRSVRTPRHLDQQRRGQLPRADDEDLVQRLQVGRRHRPAGHLQLFEVRVREVDAGQRRQHRQHRGGVRTEGHRVPGARRGGEERRVVIDAYVRGRMGALRRARQRGQSGQHRQHRRGAAISPKRCAAATAGRPIRWA